MTKPKEKSIIRSLNNYYNTKKDKYRILLDKYEKPIYKVEYNNNDEPELIAKDSSTDTTIFIAKCQTIGLYNESNSMWYWSWSIPFINKKMYTDLIKIKDFINTMKKKSKDYIPHEMEEIHFYLSNNSVYCNKEDIEPIKIALYLLKGECVIPINKINDNIKITEYVMVTDIKNLKK